jgi:SAM-dependent methyltransferase
MSLNQEQQDRIWTHYQVRNKGSFDLSYPRLRYLAELCVPRSRVLNIGVGNGYLESLLVHRGVEVFSLDPSGESIDRLRNDLAMGARAQQGYSQRMPFDPQQFDVVIITEVLEHLTDEALHATLDEVRRVLKPGGELVGTVPYREDLAANEVVCPHCQAAFHRWGHEQGFDSNSLRRLLEGHGYAVEQMYPRAFPDFRRAGFRPLLKATFRYVLGRLGEPLVGPNLYFRVRRSRVGQE